ncbi:MAG: exonuclease SbcCD subunit D [Muribaculaceae bacterium]|nr:exonuclease SbcCD subunit D [Muribaculaceae bacterium]
MKILHTSDWHLGQVFYGYDRTDENKYFLQQIKAIALEEKPDAFLLSGDIFDISNPSSTIIKVFNDFIIDLKKNLPEMKICVISGNHDSASRIDSNHSLWESLGINIISKIERKDRKFNFRKNIIVIPEKAIIAAIPFINRAFLTFENKEELPEKLFYQEMFEEINEINHSGLPVIVMSHLAVAKSGNNEESRGTIGYVNNVGHDIFGDKAAYVALGHIHRPQMIDEKGRVRYSGSPMAINFDEEYDHTVTMVEIGKEKRPNVREVLIYPLRPLITVPSEPKDFKTALKELNRLSHEQNCYIRLNVCQDKDLPADCEEMTSSIAREKNCRYCYIKFSRSQITDNKIVSRNLKADEFSRLTPDEIGADFFQDLGYEEGIIMEFSSMINDIVREIEIEKEL